MSFTPRGFWRGVSCFEIRRVSPFEIRRSSLNTVIDGDLFPSFYNP